MPRQRASQSKRDRNRRFRQYLNDPNFRVRRGKKKLAPEIKPPVDGDWLEMIAQAEKELRGAQTELWAAHIH